MNLLSSYILHKAVDKMSKESSYSGRGSDSFDSSIVRPSKKDIQNARATCSLTKQFRKENKLTEQMNEIYEYSWYKSG